MVWMDRVVCIYKVGDGYLWYGQGVVWVCSVTVVWVG